MVRSHRIAAGCIIERDGKILLVRHQTPGVHDFLVFPGGGVNEGEDAMSAAVREAVEEANFKTEVIRLAYVEEFHIMGWRECKLWFYCKDLGGIPSKGPDAPREHIISAAFYSRDELEGKTVFPLIVADPLFWKRLEDGFPSTEYLGLRETGS